VCLDLTLPAAASRKHPDQVWCGMIEAEESTRGAICSERLQEAEDRCKPPGGCAAHPLSLSQVEIQPLPACDFAAYIADLGSMRSSLPGSPERQVPPPAPHHAFFVLAATTFRLRLPRGGAPHAIGNTILYFFDEAVQAKVIKVRLAKCWVSADVGLDGIMVRVKVRAYSGSDGSYLLEVQRRQGCTVVFGSIYKKVLRFFTDHGFVVSATLPDFVPTFADFWSSPLTVPERPVCR